jgi:predicted dehydrogenase
MTITIGVLGLGVQGRRMLARLAEQDAVRAVAAWDPRPETGDAGGVRICASAEEVVRSPEVDCVYIASPPALHMPQANLAFDAGKAVFCEKPLAVSHAEARATIERIGREGRRAAVNFSLAASAGLAAMLAALREGALGELRAVEIEVRFRQWPRPWQSAAGAWLGERAEGGFTREVLSHFVFALQRALGQATVERSVVDWPRDGKGSELGVTAQLRAGGVPVKVEGHVAGDAADFNRFALVGSRSTIEFTDWFATRVGSAQPDASARPGYLRQLDELAAFIEGRPHVLPDFAEALAVQDTIEAMLA